MIQEIENTKRALERLQNSNSKNSPGENFEKQFQNPPKKKLTGLDKYLIFSFTVLILFTIAILITFLITHEEPTVLVGCFFTAFGGEVLLCARIKKYKLYKEAELTNGGGDDYGN